MEIGLDDSMGWEKLVIVGLLWNTGGSKATEMLPARG